MQRDCPCACAEVCLCPHNSTSNVVAFVMIHDKMKIFLRDVCKKKTRNHRGRSKASLTEHHGTVSDVHIVRKTWVLVAKDKSNHPVADSFHTVPQESWS